MAEDIRERPNRWEGVKQGELYPIAQFVEEFERRSSKLPKKTSQASVTYKTLIDLLYISLQRDIVYSQLL